ncbi:hypothetical protein B0I29_104396 [Actinoplanes lutulentus]|uniref:Uncharacterized protein n=1 Tax=Actinoplanes lutulentus TaxID=1287878 RepID=A0A327ZL10_9ACTN|nr:hypothetical protein B0I29_104396 [Actinoplanes lutulentus]
MITQKTIKATMTTRSETAPNAPAPTIPVMPAADTPAVRNAYVPTLLR